MERAYVPGTGTAHEGAEEAAPDGGPEPVEELSERSGKRRLLGAVPLPLRGRQRLFQGAGWTALLLFSDTVLLLLGNVAALVGAPEGTTGVEGDGLVWLFPPIVLALLVVWKMYRDAIQLRIVDGIGQVLAATSLAAISLIATAALLDPEAGPAQLLARAWLFGTVYLAGGRILLGWAQRRARVTRLIAKPTLIVGAGQIGAHVERRLREQPALGLLPIGYLDGDPPPGDKVPDREVAVLGAPEDLRPVAKATGAKHVVLGFSTAPDSRLIPLVRESEALGLEVSVVPRLFENINVHVGLQHLGGLPLYGLRSIDPKGWQFAIKHALDFMAAAFLVVVLGPVLLALAAAVKLSSPGPVLFRQRRIGRDGRDFEILKFRSMRIPEDPGEVPGNVVQLPSDIAPGGVEGVDRRTPIGSFLRRSSLDELPQIFNVLRGDMSLVGPRPERPEFVDMFGPRINRYGDRHRVKSGMTGWAQVHGFRGKTSLRDRVEWDNYYIENWSLALDLKILLMTLLVILRPAE